jgi:hypothetical protein
LVSYHPSESDTAIHPGLLRSFHKDERCEISIETRASALFSGVPDAARVSYASFPGIGVAPLLGRRVSSAGKATLDDNPDPPIVTLGVSI